MAMMLERLSSKTVRDARVARALRIRIHRLKVERRERARTWEEREHWHRAEQEVLLDQILMDGTTLRRLRSLIHSLEFEGGAS
jgi:hypothetical protein